MLSEMSKSIGTRQILDKLNDVQKDMRKILSYMEDAKLTEDDKKALKHALKEEKAGKLLGKKHVFG